MAMIGDAKKVAIIGCGSCVTGGEKEVDELKAYLDAHGRTVVATAMADYCCMNLTAKGKDFAAAGAEVVVCMSCGDGVQVVTGNVPVPVYPSNNTMFLGEAVKFGLFEEACHL